MKHRYETTASSSPLFRSFWLAGYESACHITRGGVRLDMIQATQHDQQVDHDFALLREIGISTVREGIGWPCIERGDGFDFASLEPLIAAAKRHNIQVVWNVCHYGWPDDLDVFSPAFVERFARFCGAVARFMAEQSDEVPLYAPINEMSFLAWAAGEVGYIHPCATGRGSELKHQLVRAAIAGCDAIWAVEPRARIVHIDPLIHVVPPRDQPDLAARAAAHHAGQFESWDMLSGRTHPELGGHPRYLDVIGVNYYHSNQWEYPGDGPESRLRWEDTPRDTRWRPLHDLLAEVYERYHRPLFIAETSHFGSGRARWISEIGDEVRQALDNGVPLEGVCLYPIIDRPDWDNAEHWHNSGLWDLIPDDAGRLQRVLHRPYADALLRAQKVVGLVAGEQRQRAVGS